MIISVTAPPLLQELTTSLKAASDDHTEHVWNLLKELGCRNIDVVISAGAVKAAVDLMHQGRDQHAMFFLFEIVSQNICRNEDALLDSGAIQALAGEAARGGVDDLKMARLFFRLALESSEAVQAAMRTPDVRSSLLRLEEWVCTFEAKATLFLISDSSEKASELAGWLAGKLIGSDDLHSKKQLL